MNTSAVWGTAIWGAAIWGSAVSVAPPPLPAYVLPRVGTVTPLDRTGTVTPVDRTGAVIEP